MKILASDYDGTLRIEELVDKKDIDAIKAWRLKGNAFGLVTGRSVESIMSEFKHNDIQLDFLVANNGGVIYNQKLEKLKDYFFDFDKAMELIEYIKSIHCISYVLNDGYHRCRVIMNPDKIDKKYGDLKTVVTADEVIQNRKIAQVVVSLEDERAVVMAEKINQLFAGYVCAYPNLNCIDIVPHGVSKAEGLLFIERYMGYEHDDIYTIGDSYNDLPMLEEFHGISVAHAEDVIKEAADMSVVAVRDAMAFLLKKE